MCPAETTLSDLLAGLLPKEQRSDVLAHVEGCADCQRALAAAGGDSTSSQLDASFPAVPAPLARGATLARYVVLERIGAGAMGVVYAAYDPRLDRQVALKVLRPEGRQVEELRLRLVQEAQALARLSHANVVAVFDVGSQDDCVFLAMELVDGVTLAEWLKQQRSLEEVLRVFNEAGRGLAAAHAAGLVHRDFKPANVLVGRDGRARVTDFGMARPLNREQGAAPRVGPAVAASTGSPTASPLASPLTRTGVLLGTPAYMAPELLGGRRADALSDQFSFCVALHEALYGVRPFEGDSLEAMARAALEGRVRPAGREAKVPAWVRRAVLRGLLPRPEARYPSMEPLLAALTPPPRRLRARVAALTGTACLLGAAGAYAVAHRSEAHCAQEAEKLGAAWGPTQREQVRAAFLATGAPYASLAWEKVSAMLDAHASQWRTLRTEACLAASRQPTSTAWQTSACLDTRLWQLASVTDVLRKADAQTVRNAQQLASSLEGLEGCRDAPALSTRPQPPDALRPRVDAARRKLADAEALRATSRYGEGLQLTSALLEELKGLDFKPLEAEVLLTHGYLHAQYGKPKEAEGILYKSIWAAEAGRDDETNARAWNLLLWVVGDELARSAEAERIAHHARAAVARLGRERFPDITADLHYRLGAVLMTEGKYDQADTEVTQGLELVRRVHGSGSLHTADFLHTLGRVRVRQRRYEEALALHQQALTLRERLLGAEHPELISILNSLALDHERLGRTDESIAALRRAIAIHGSAGSEENVFLAAPLKNLAFRLRTQGLLDEAWKHQQRALAIYERIRGPDHPDTALTVAALARLAGDAERIDEALALFQDSLDRLQRSLGPESPRAVTSLLFRAELYLRLGRYAEARRDAERARALQEKQHGPNSANAAMALGPLAGAALGAGAPREALALCQRSRELNESVQGPDSMDVGRDVLCLAEAHLALGEPEKALPLAERARERLGSSSGERWDTGRATFVLARVLLALKPPDRARATAMAGEAQTRFETLGLRARRELEHVVAWRQREGLR